MPRLVAPLRSDLDGFAAVPLAAGNIVWMPTPGSYDHVLSANSRVSLPEFKTDALRSFTLALEQPTSGGFTVAFMSTIAWEDGAPPVVSTSPGSITYLEFRWLGTTRGYFGRVTATIPAYTTPLPSTVNGAPLYLTGQLMRGATTTLRDFYCSNLQTYVPAALRQKLATNGITVQIATGPAPTDNPGGADYRGGTTENALEFFNDHVLCLVDIGDTSNDTNISAEHELGHANDLRFNGGNGTTVPYVRLSDDATISTVYTNLVSATGYTNTKIEWFAEMCARYWRNGSKTQLLECKGNQTAVDGFNNRMNALGALSGALPAAVFGSIGTYTANASTTAVVPVPASTVNGDLLIMTSCNGAPAAHTTPAGWTALGAAVVLGDVSMQTWWRIASSEPASYTLSGSGSGSQAAQMTRITNVHTAAPIVSSAFATSSAVSGTSPALPALTGQSASNLTVAIYGWGAGVSGAPPTQTMPGAPYTSRSNLVTAVATGYNVAVGSVDQANGTTSPTASSTVTTGAWGVQGIVVAAGP